MTAQGNTSRVSSTNKAGVSFLLTSITGHSRTTSGIETLGCVPVGPDPRFQAHGSKSWGSHAERTGWSWPVTWGQVQHRPKLRTSPRNWSTLVSQIGLSKIHLAHLDNITDRYVYIDNVQIFFSPGYKNHLQEYNSQYMVKVVRQLETKITGIGVQPWYPWYNVWLSVS